MYKISDISIVIPTYNRARDLEITLKSGITELRKVKETLIIDQSKDKETYKLVKNLKNKKVKYFHLKNPTLTGARNYGIRKTSKNSKIIVFLDDDVNLSKNYLKEIVEIYNKYPEALGVSGYQKNNGRNKLDWFFRKIFLLENLEDNSAEVKSVYGTVYPSRLDRVINAQWLCGYNMSYKKKVFKKNLFDENLEGYALGEDFDFSYRVWKENKEGLFITPRAIVVHRFSGSERLASKKSSYMNQIHHFYLNYKNFNSGFLEKTKFLWALSGITLLRTLKLLLLPNKNNFLKLKFYLESIILCLKKRDDLKRGRLKNLYKFI